MTPDHDPLFADVLARRIEQTAADDGPKAFATEDSVIRHSWAGKCSRAIGYSILDNEPTDPPDRTSLYTMGLGTVIHEQYQDALVDYYGDKVKVEVPVVIPEIRSSGHVDAVIDDGFTTVVLELKTINSYGYAKAIGMKGKPEGPRYTAIIQAALNAIALDADAAVVVYLPVEAVSRNKIEQAGLPEHMRHCAQWTFDRLAYRKIALQEMDRLKWVLEHTDKGELPARYIPDWTVNDQPIVITDPERGKWTDGNGKTGQTWQCTYCDFQGLCIRDAAKGE